MVAKIIDGKSIAARIRAESRDRVERIFARGGTRPGLAVIFVGDDPASQVYVRNKMRACADVGIRSFSFDFPRDTEFQTVIDLIDRLNHSPEVHGILVQLPLPPSFDISHILRTISVDKDVDGFHLYNVGGLVVGGSVFPPCTPYGVLKILQFGSIPLEGKTL